MSTRTVFCKKFKREMPGLQAPPFAGELGEQVYKEVSADAWHQWSDDMMIKIINEYRLNLAVAEQYEVLIKQMRAFLGLDSDDVLEVENAERGRS
jgi:Fe-S cluster biosynthesis and repair protein YggX